MSLIGRPRKGFNVTAYNQQKRERDKNAAGGWHCKKCKGTFATMAEMQYHTCEPVKFQRPTKAEFRPRTEPKP